jgi:hypothetical protein
MFVKLDGWTKIGDKVSPTGKWTVYRFRGGEFDDVTAMESFPPDDPDKAAKLYKATITGMKRGAVWLIAPDGRVDAMLFIRPGEAR